MKLATLAITATCLAVPAAAAEKCLPTPEAYERLTNDYGEERKGYGVTDSGAVVEFWSGEKSWTAFVTLPNGISCMMASGVDWGYDPVKEGPNL